VNLPHITICDCVTERTGVPHVFIPCLQYDALMAAEEFVRTYMAAADKTGERGSLYGRGERILAALRAAGIQIEGT
jgi:hypothetical protein